jgi:hypothetical protein
MLKILFIILICCAFTTPDFDLVLRKITPDEIRFYRQSISKINRVAWYDLSFDKEYLVPINSSLYKDWSPIPKELDEFKNYPKVILVILDEFFCGIYEYGHQVNWNIMLAGKTTPKGMFKILKKDKEHMSRTYLTSDGRPTPMPNALNIQGAYWLHGGDARFPYHISHGCVNIPNNFAEIVYEWADLDTLIIIKDKM